MTVFLIDHVSFTIMRRMEIAKAFTNDGHFRAAGFETLF
jgi:predicted nucleic acid-binding protein